MLRVAVHDRSHRVRLADSLLRHKGKSATRAVTDIGTMTVQNQPVKVLGTRIFPPTVSLFLSRLAFLFVFCRFFSRQLWIALQFIAVLADQGFGFDSRRNLKVFIVQAHFSATVGNRLSGRLHPVCCSRDLLCVERPYNILCMHDILLQIKQ